MADENSPREDARHEAGDERRSDKAKPTDRKKQVVRAGVAVGIGSAAIVAALLYANRGKGGDRS